MYIKKIKKEIPFIPFHLILDVDCERTKSILHDILHDYIMRYASHATDQTDLCKTLLKKLDE